MKILAFDTSTSACTVALQNGTRIHMVHQIAPLQQAHLILPTIQDLLSKAFLTLNDLDAIAYGCGPGSFTGIRISSSVAQGIGFAIKKPIIPISSLATLAQSAFLNQHSSHFSMFLVAVDARMSQIYWAVYKSSQTGIVELIDKEQLVTPSEVKLPENDKMCGIGDGWETYKETLMIQRTHNPTTIYASQLPSAKALLQLAKSKFENGEWVDAANAIPVYLERE